MRIKREDNERRAYWMAEAMSDTTNNLLCLTSALNARMLWHERRTEVRINSYYYFYSHPYGWWWCDEADNMLCKCCAEALFLRLQIFVMQNRQRLRIFYGDFTRVCIGRCERHGGREQRAEGKRVKSQKAIYDAALRSAIQILSANDKITSCMHYVVFQWLRRAWLWTTLNTYIRLYLNENRYSIHTHTCIHVHSQWRLTHIEAKMRQQTLKKLKRGVLSLENDKSLSDKSSMRKYCWSCSPPALRTDPECTGVCVNTISRWEKKANGSGRTSK